MPYASVDAYIASFTHPQREKLAALRALIRETAPDCEERLAWGAPTYYLCGRYFVQFAAAKRWIGFYTSPAALAECRDALAGFETNEKNTVRFPWLENLPREAVKGLLWARRKELEAEIKEKKP